MKTKKIKLSVELVPKSCWGINVRSTVNPKEWDIIRFMSYAKAENKCEICQQNGLDQGFPHRLECHEIWQYNNNEKVQKLIGLISLCPLCHLVKHIGRAFAMGKQPLVFKHLENVNGWEHKQVVEHVAESYELYKKRSKSTWKLDLSLLREEPYNLIFKTPKKKPYKKPKSFKRKKR